MSAEELLGAAARDDFIWKMNVEWSINKDMGKL